MITRDELYATIVRWLEQHYMVHWFDLCDEESILLVDVLSVPQDKDISTGEDEIHSIADTVLDALEEYLSIADARDAENARLVKRIADLERAQETRTESIRKLQTRVRRLEIALMPFAELGVALSDYEHDDCPFYSFAGNGYIVQLTFGDIYRAKEILNEA